MIGSLLLENVQESLTAADVNMTRLRDVKNIVCIAGARYVRDNFSGLVYHYPLVRKLRADGALPYPALLIREHERFYDVAALDDFVTAAASGGRVA